MGLKEAREKKGMTIYALSEAVNVTPATICRYEKGLRTPSVAIAKRIEKVLGIPWPEIIDNKVIGAVENCPDGAKTAQNTPVKPQAGDAILREEADGGCC